LKKKSKYPKISKFAGRRVSKKIAKLVREGKSPEQAAAIAFNMEQKHRLGPRGGRKNPIPLLLLAHGAATYKHLERRKMHRHKNPIEDKDLWMVLATLCGLMKLPSRYVDVPRPLLQTLRDEGLYNDDDGVTSKGKSFINEAVKAQSKIEGHGGGWFG
jgi:hypothetical protein